MIQITAVSFADAKAHEHIAAVLWHSASTPAGHSASEAIIAWLDSSSANRAVVADGSDYIEVAVARTANRSPYIRTRAGGVWTDHLLGLPTF
jgi:hypothetical protein